MTMRSSAPTGRLPLPDLGRRGGGWVLLQVVLLLVIVGLGLIGPAWSGPARVVGACLGIALGVSGLGLVIAGILALRRQLTAYPRPVPGGHTSTDGLSEPMAAMCESSIRTSACSISGGERRRTTFVLAIYPSLLITLTPGYFWYLSLHPRGPGKVDIIFGCGTAVQRRDEPAQAARVAESRPWAVSTRWAR